MASFLSIDNFLVAFGVVRIVQMIEYNKFLSQSVLTLRKCFFKFIWVMILMFFFTTSHLNILNNSPYHVHHHQRPIIGLSENEHNKVP